MFSVSTNTKDYIKVYSKVFDKKFCKALIKELNNDLNWEKHDWHDGYNLVSSTYNTELSVNFNNNQSTQYIMKTLYNVIDDYHKTILKNHHWYQSWLGYSSIRYNKYEVNQEMKLHCDHIRSIFPGSPTGIPILSLVGVLNDDYEGGDLCLIDKEYKLKKGSVIIFPSNFMYPHLVKPVTKGTRYSFVSWIW